jgi:hypothetical protein
MTGSVKFPVIVVSDGPSVAAPGLVSSQGDVVLRKLRLPSGYASAVHGAGTAAGRRARTTRLSSSNP